MTGNDFSEHTITVNRLGIHVVEWHPTGDGDPARPPMILLHGVTSHARYWDHIAREFRDAYRVLAVDMRGFGDSQWSSDQAYESADLASDVTALFAALELSGAVIVGASWGGLVGMIHAAEHPETVSKLVLVDIGCEFGQTETEIPQRSWEFADYRELEVAERSVNPYPALWTMRPGLRAECREQDGKLVRKQDPVYAARWPFRNTTYWDYAQRLRCPVLLIRGAESFVLSPEMAEKTAASIADCRLVEVPHAGHAVFLDNPPAFQQALWQFLNE